MKNKKEIGIGLIVFISLVLLYFGFNFLKGQNIFSKSRQFVSIYSSIDGLSVDNPVLVNGYKVGRIQSIELLPERKSSLLVRFTVDEKKLNVPKNTIAQISSVDILGSKSIILKLGNSLEYAQSGDTLSPEVEEDLKSVVDKRIQPLEKKAVQLISSIDSAVIIVQSILDTSARENLSASFRSLKRSFSSLERTAFKLDQLMETEQEKIRLIFSNVESITNNFRKSNRQLTNVINNFSDISDSLQQANIASTINNANIALQQVTQVINKINEGEGSLSLLLNDDKLYNNLEQATLELDKLLEDFRVNPKRYVHFSVFGKKEKSSEKPDKKERE